MEWEPMYTVIHLLVVDVSCVLVWDQARWLGPKQNTRNIYHKQMNNGVVAGPFYRYKAIAKKSYPKLLHPTFVVLKPTVMS